MRLWQAIKAFFQVLVGKEDKKKTPAETKEIKKDKSHLLLLKILQEKGRFIDFFQEDISNFTDAQIGAAVRKVHQDCRNELEDLFAIRPLLEKKEGEEITLPEGIDPREIKLVGNVTGKAPYKGKVTHPGWICKKESLPKSLTGLEKKPVLAPAEVEIS